MGKKSKKERIYLRAHHLLCLQGYDHNERYGHDEKYIKNMSMIFHKLDILNINNDNKKSILKPKIILIDYPDVLCESCSKLKENKLTGEYYCTYFGNLKQNKENIEKIKINNIAMQKIDQRVLKESKLKKNTEYPIDEAILAVNKAFSTLKNAKKVCGNCKWENKCLWIKSRKTINK